jgi:hypothetical protein
MDRQDWFWQFKALRLLLKSTIGEIWKNVPSKRSTKKTGSQQVITLFQHGMIGCFALLMLHGVLVRIQSDETLAT